MNYYPHHIGDFNSATRHLTRLERSVYRDMLDLYYDTESPLMLDMDSLCRLLIARSNEERTAVEQVLNEFFTQTEHGWRHARCDAEIERYTNQIEAKSAAGKASAAKRASKTQQSTNSHASNADQMNNERSTGVEQPLNDCATNQNQNHNQEPIKEIPPNPRKRGKSFDASVIDLPEWLDRECWVSWVADRKARKKPITEEAARLQIKQLGDYRTQGHKPEDVIASSIAGGYQGLFPPRQAARPGPTSRSQALADWSAELRSELGQGRPHEIDMGVIDASH